MERELWVAVEVPPPSDDLTLNAFDEVVEGYAFDF
jgi:hypothetical protein